MTSMTSRLPPMTTTMKTNKDSFDRFGDDLTGLLLGQLLTLADRMRLECVCRQWQRLVYNSGHHWELIIDKQLVEKMSRISPDRRRRRRQQFKYYDFTRLISLAGKCGGHRCRAIKFNTDAIDPLIVDQIMSILVNNYGNNNSGHNIYSFDVHVCHDWLSPNMQSLFKQITRFGRLRHLAIDCPIDSYYIQVNPYTYLLPKVAKQCPDIRSLGLRIHAFYRSNISDNLNDVQLFPQLVSLKFAVYIMVYTNHIQLSVKSLANCSQLKHLSLDSTPNISFTDVDLINRQLKRPAIVTKS